MTEKHNPSGSELQSAPSLSKKLLALAATGSFLAAGCSTSSEAMQQSNYPAPSETIASDTQQSENVTQSAETSETIKEIYEGKPTRENWNMDNLSKLTTEWNELDELQRQIEVQAFLESNIQGLDLDFWERSPEGVKKMAENMHKVYGLIMELSFNPQIEKIDVLLENIITTMSANDEVKDKLIARVQENLSVEREQIGQVKDEQKGHLRSEWSNVQKSVKTSDDFFVNKHNDMVFVDVFYTRYDIDEIDEEDNSWIPFLHCITVKRNDEVGLDHQGIKLLFTGYLTDNDAIGKGIGFGGEEIAWLDLYDRIPGRY